MSNYTHYVFPAGAEQCVRLHPGGSNACTVTSDMLSNLNFTNFQDFFPAYCLNPGPPIDDGCPYGFCPNADIGGPFVRVSAYLTNHFVAILIFHDPEGLKASFWSQILSVYSIIIPCVIAIITRSLTRIHAILATTTAGSPLNIYIVIYAIRTMWGNANHLGPTLRRGQIIPRIMVLGALVAWIGLTVYIMLPSHLSHFVQVDCERKAGAQLVPDFYFLHVVLFRNAQLSGPWKWTMISPVPLAVVSWIIAIWRRRREIWSPGKQYSPRFWRVWQVVGDNYPFIKYASVVVIPFVYWVLIIELGTMETNDNRFTLTFGQVLEMFVALPPMIQVARLIPRFYRWFIDLSWVRFVTCRPQRRGGSSMAIPLVLGSAPYEKYDKDDAKTHPPSPSIIQTGTIKIS
ncbi:hypothetical protein JB92DRAFT_1624088 [Gautieria morchelliformis]|nr:hypothetical protein JB92DRAFT_1624088 [Gautieria morchelliformis]